MAVSRFAVWTRRRLGLVTAGAAALHWLPVSDDVAAKKNKKKKKCKKSEKRCGKKCVKGTCCPGKKCGGGECQCTRTVEGKAFCKPNNGRLGDICNLFGGCVACAGSAACENSFRCVKDSSFGAYAVCQPPCDFQV